MGKGMQQALDYARLLDVPFSFVSNGDGIIALCDRLKFQLSDTQTIQFRFTKNSKPNIFFLMVKDCGQSEERCKSVIKLSVIVSI